MPEPLTCLQGHAWDAPAAGESARCPECGLPPDPGLFSEPDDAPPVPPPPISDDGGRPVVAGYEIVAESGRTAAGVRLYRARQLVAGREVLLQVVLAREDAGQRAWNALRGEAGGHGKLSHPNIVQLYEAGERDRQLFYNAMESVDGPTLAEAVGGEPVAAAEAVALVELLARAVAYANEQRQIHRHLEPSAVLLQRLPAPKGGPAVAEPGGGVCRIGEAFYLPRIRGFGLARRPVEGDILDIDLYAEAGYLSPEQSWGKGHELGPHTDVYGLGGILYFLLTGRPPFRGPNQDDILDAIQTAALVDPSAGRRTPATVEFVCRTALARRLSRRYADAGEMADDLRRVMENQSPARFRPSAGQRIDLWRKRRPGWAAVLLMGAVCAGSTLIAYALGTSGSSDTVRIGPIADGGAMRAENVRLRERLREATEWQRKNDYRGRMTFAALMARANARAARRALGECPEAERGFEWHYLDRLLRGEEKTTLPDSDDATAFAFVPETGPATAAAFGRPRRKTAIAVATSNPDGKASTVRVMDIAPGGERFRMTVPAAPVRRIRHLLLDHFVCLAGTWPGRLCQVDRNGPATCNDTVGSPTLLGGGAPNGRTFVLNDLGHLQFHDANGRPGGVRRLLEDELADFFPRKVAILVSGPNVVIADPGAGKIRVWDAEQPLVDAQDLDIPIHGKVECMASTVEGLLAVATSEKLIHFHDPRMGRDNASPHHAAMKDVKQLTFSPDGNRLAVAHTDGTIAILGFMPPRPEGLRTNGKEESGEWREMLTIPASGVHGLEFGPDGKTLAASGPKGVVVLGAWD